MSAWTEPWVVQPEEVGLTAPDAPQCDVEHYGTTNSAVKLSLAERSALRTKGGMQQFRTVINVRERMRHPAIPQFFGVILSPEDQNPCWLMIEKLDDAKSLSEWVRSSPLPDSSTILDVAKQLCLSLVFLHAQSIPHGNLSAANVLIGRGNDVKVSGIAEQLLHYARAGSKPGPEQDIRAFGRILIQMCLGLTEEPTKNDYLQALKRFPSFSLILSTCLGPKETTAPEILSLIEKLIPHHTMGHLTNMDLRIPPSSSGEAPPLKRQREN